MKTCSKCDSRKPLADFSADKRRQDGRRANCKACVKAGGAEYRKQNRAKVLARKKARREANPEAAREADRAWREKNPRSVREAERAWYARNKEKKAANYKAWRAENPHKINAIKAKRRSAQLLRTPKWLTEQDFAAIEFIYAGAKVLEASTGLPHHVDHIYPLQRRYVSGLHVPANLQVLTASENCSKSNRWIPE